MQTIDDIFDRMTQRTYIYGEEYELIDMLPNMQKDMFGNYYKIICNNPNYMFCCHLDTYGNKGDKIKKTYYNIRGDMFISTDGNTILGADDKAGVSILISMIENGIEGVYYFFVGEEKGCIGSYNVSLFYDLINHLKPVCYCISFDKDDTTSVVTTQLGKSCCSDMFANSLMDAFSNYNIYLEKDDGICCDSAMFMNHIPECTNISVGYFNNHTNNEYQNMTYLNKLNNACLNIDWKEVCGNECKQKLLKIYK